MGTIEPQLPPEMVSLGNFGNISGLMSQLGRRKDPYLDLAIVGKAGKRLMCHKFVIAAQSNFLRKMLLMSGATEDGTSVINLPDVEDNIIKIVLKFLYSGSLRIRKNEIPAVKEVLEKVGEGKLATGKNL